MINNNDILQWIDINEKLSVVKLDVIRDLIMSLCNDLVNMLMKQSNPLKLHMNPGDVYSSQYVNVSMIMKNEKLKSVVYNEITKEIIIDLIKKHDYLFNACKLRKVLVDKMLEEYEIHDKRKVYNYYVN